MSLHVCFFGSVLLGVSAWNRSWFRSRGRIKQGEVETHAPVGPVTRRVCVIFSADLKTDGLLPNLQNLADLKNERHGPFRVAWRVVPVGRRFRAQREGRVRLERVGDERLKKHLAKALPVLLDGD